MVVLWGPLAGNPALLPLRGEGSGADRADSEVGGGEGAGCSTSSRRGMTPLTPNADAAEAFIDGLEGGGAGAKGDEGESVPPRKVLPAVWRRGRRSRLTSPPATDGGCRKEEDEGRRPLRARCPLVLAAAGDKGKATEWEWGPEAEKEIASGTAAAVVATE